MSVYGLALFFWSLVSFRSDVVKPKDDSIRKGANVVEQASQRYVSKVLFGATIATNFTRNFAKTILEVGAFVTCMQYYRLGDISNVCLFALAASLFVGRAIVAWVHKMIPDEIAMLKVLERVELFACPLLFRYGLLPEEAGLSVFLLACMIFYNANGCQSGVIMTAASRVAIKNDMYLSKSALTTYTFFSNVAAYFLGPVVAFVAMATVTSQNVMAAMLASVAVSQYLVTKVALSFMEVQANKQDTHQASPAHETRVAVVKR